MKKKIAATLFVIIACGISIIFAPLNLWVQILNSSEKLFFETKIHNPKLELSNSWFDFQGDGYTASMPAPVITDFQSSVVTFLNTYGDVEQLKNELETTPGITYVDIQKVDFSGDDSEEVIICIEFLRKSTHASVIWVVGKIENKYEILFQENGSGFVYTPRIIMIGDINNDGEKEVVASVTWVGSDAEIKPFVLSPYPPSKYVTSVFGRDLVPLGNTDIIIDDIDGDKVKEILLTGRKWHRGNMDEQITYVYKWNGSFYRLVENYTP
jgi:hypothetical protein